MFFNSFHFLVFFPVVALLLYVFPQRFRWMWLLVASYYFYMAWDPWFALLLLGVTIVTYLCGRAVSYGNGFARKKRVVRIRRLVCASGVIIIVGALLFFKYFYFVLDNLNILFSQFGLQIAQPSFTILQPVGISFFTLQALGYVIDVYRQEIPVEQNFGKYALFVSFFPQLLSGPIGRAKNFLPQIDEKRSFDRHRVKNGLLCMLWGFVQKLIIADRAALLVNEVFGNYRGYAGIEILVAVLIYALQLYCDFAGYSDIAIGAAKVMGFRLTDNFRQPYFATSIREFWRRWHISLSSWFRDYLYIPLGGNRKAHLRKYINVMLTFLASGLWHGASWNFMIWGGLHGTYQVIGDITGSKKQQLYKRLRINTHSSFFRFLQWAVTFGLVCFAWIFFRAPDIGSALGIIRQMVTCFNPWVLFDGSLYEMGLGAKQFWLLAFFLLLLGVADILRRRINVPRRIALLPLPFRWGLYFAGIFSILVFGMYGPGYSASSFVYFQF